MGAAQQHRGDRLIRMRADAETAAAVRRQGQPERKPRQAPAAAASQAPPTPAGIKRWMRAHLDEYRDPRTGEVNLTELVEAWDRECADGGATLDSDHIAWEIATKVGVP